MVSLLGLVYFASGHADDKKRRKKKRRNGF